MPIHHGYTMCWWCKHFTATPGRLGFHFSCTAFPDDIPDPIFDGEFDHREHYPGDHDTHFSFAPVEISRERWMFQHTQDFDALVAYIEEIFRNFDVYRVKGSLQPPLISDSLDESDGL